MGIDRNEDTSALGEEEETRKKSSSRVGQFTFFHLHMVHIVIGKMVDTCVTGETMQGDPTAFVFSHESWHSGRGSEPLDRKAQRWRVNRCLRVGGSGKCSHQVRAPY